MTTARARLDRTTSDIVTIIEECLALGDTERLGHILSLVDAALVGLPVQRPGAIHDADEADAKEDVLESEFRRNPTKQTARAWFDALGKEGRLNEPCMAILREQWGF